MKRQCQTEPSTFRYEYLGFFEGEGSPSGPAVVIGLSRSALVDFWLLSSLCHLVDAFSVLQGC